MNSAPFHYYTLSHALPICHGVILLAAINREKKENKASQAIELSDEVAAANGVSRYKSDDESQMTHQGC